MFAKGNGIPIRSGLDYHVKSQPEKTHSTAKAWKLLLLFTSLDQLRFPHKIQSDLCYLCSLISNMFMKTAGAFSEFFCTSFRSQCGWKPPIRVHHAPSLHGFANSPTATGGVKRFRYIKQHATSISEKLRGYSAIYSNMDVAVIFHKIF